MSRLVLLSPQFLTFILGGGLSALVDIALMQILIYQGFAPFAATTVGFLSGLCVNYAFHAKVTFKNVTNFATLSRFLGVVLINYLITLCFVALSLSLVNMALVGKIVSLPIVAINGFLLSKYWVFK